MESKPGIILKGVTGMPLLLPKEILSMQRVLGIEAVLLWINLLALAQEGEPMNLDQIAETMGLSYQVIEKALVTLADSGWISDEGREIRLKVARDLEPKKQKAVLDDKQAGFEWLVGFWCNKLQAPSPEQLQKLLFWMEKKALSHEVIAAAIEEMCACVESPHISYLEGILRNWYNDGVREYEDLVQRPYLTKLRVGTTQNDQIHPEAKKRWQEVFPHEFND